MLVNSLPLFVGFNYIAIYNGTIFKQKIGSKIQVFVGEIYLIRIMANSERLALIRSKGYFRITNGWHCADRIGTILSVTQNETVLLCGTGPSLIN